MRIIKDTSPRYRVQGLKSMRGVSFKTEKEAREEMQVQAIASILWKEQLNGKSVYEFARAIHKHQKQIAKVASA